METAVEWILSLVGVYFIVGLLFAIPFVLVGAKRIDPGAAAGSWGFKVLIIPGTMVFWPLLMSRWLRNEDRPEEYSAHRRQSQEGRGHRGVEKS